MLSRCCSLALLASALLLSISVSAASLDSSLLRRDDDAMTTPGHSHSHAGPLLELNETQILQSHAPDPPSYWSHDFEADGEQHGTWTGLMALHVLGMSFAFFILLPVGIALRSSKHRWHSAAVVAFNVVAFSSSAAGSLYKKLTGDFYQGSVHGSSGFLVLFLVAALATCDALALLGRAVSFLRSGDRRNVRLFWRIVVLNQQDQSAAEYTSLVHEEPQEYDEAKLEAHSQEPRETRRARFAGTIDTSHGHDSEWVNQEEWPQSAASHRTLVNEPRHSINSSHSDDTLHSPTFIRNDSNDSYDHHPQRSWLVILGRVAIATAERVLVLMAFMQLLTGITVYTGICRGNYANGCLAHLIKGGIFWCYGLLTFGRYLGAWADLGWAWNRLPSSRTKRIPTAEMVESSVIFLYGITNTWMERFGAAPGSPFTTKEVQHISIAVMFWFAGLLGIALESKSFRRWLSSPARAVVKPDESVPEPPSYAGSFNPFPSLVIGVTGVAMSAHHQTYLFQVQIHALWGFFLAGFAVLRWLTYFFLWLRPPHSILPPRPPTEALAAFCLASGGLVFILSTEQITFAAMRQGYDDAMFFFNFAVAVTCLAFCWLLSITAFKGWITSATRPSYLSRFARRVNVHAA